MKIGNPADVHLTESLRATQTAATRQAGSAGGAAIEQTSGAASVRLSDTSRNLAAETGRTGEPIRAAKVEEIRKAINEGRFQVNPDVVADKMISEAAELIETLSRKQ